MSNKTSGAIIYPLTEENLKLLKEKDKPFYVKYLSKMSSLNPTRLKPGHFVFFYLSHKNKSIIAYSKINKILVKTPYEIKESIINNIQMNKAEFEKYISKRQLKSLVVLDLEEIIDFKNARKIEDPITMAGKYISTEDALKLINRKND